MRTWHLALIAVASIGVKQAAPPQVQPRPSGAVRVLIDEGHNNYHTSTGGYAALTRLLRQNGFVVSPLTERFTPSALTGADVLISASALPEPRETLVQKAKQAGEQFEWSRTASSAAFSIDEISPVQAWVRAGGSLLLVLDHAPNGGAGQSLAAAFGVDVRNSFTADSAFQTATPEFPNPGHFSFTRRDGRIGDHPILTGVDDVRTYTGSSLQAPPGAAILLRLPSTAVDRIWNAEKKQFEPISAAGRAQGVALDYGGGRVVVLGEAGMLTTDPGRNTDYCGTRAIAQPDIGNRRLALNIVRWLARKEVGDGAAPTFVNSGCAAPPGLTLTIEGDAGTSASFVGRWIASLPNLQNAISIALKLEGDRVAGDFTVGTEILPLLRGSLSGNRITFVVKSPNGVRTVTFTGTVAGDEIKFERRVEVPPGGAPGGTGLFGVRGPQTFVAVREK